MGRERVWFGLAGGGGRVGGEGCGGEICLGSYKHDAESVATGVERRRGTCCRVSGEASGAAKEGQEKVTRDVRVRERSLHPIIVCFLLGSVGVRQ